MFVFVCCICFFLTLRLQWKEEKKIKWNKKHCIVCSIRFVIFIVQPMINLLWRNEQKPKKNKWSNRSGRLTWPETFLFPQLTLNSNCPENGIWISAKKNEFTSNLIDTHMLARVNDTSIKLDECQLLFSSCCE